MAGSVSVSVSAYDYDYAHDYAHAYEERSSRDSLRHLREKRPNLRRARSRSEGLLNLLFG
jgi:hypothetical protein